MHAESKQGYLSPTALGPVARPEAGPLSHHHGLPDTPAGSKGVRPSLLQVPAAGTRDPGTQVSKLVEGLEVQAKI